MKRDRNGRLHMPPAIPEGGQYASEKGSINAAPVHIGSQDTFQVQAKARTGEGLVDLAPSRWWGNQLGLAEHHLDPSQAFPKMPDDNTPSMGGGRSIFGRRHTHRIRYQGANGFEVRMPSVTAIKRHADNLENATFDVPVSTKIGSREVAGWVRVTRSASGSWATTPIGFPDKGLDGVRVGESVCALLEARRPRSALVAYQDVAELRRLRLTAEGTLAQPVNSTWIKRLGYDDQTKEMVTIVKDGDKQYRHKVPRTVFDKIANSKAPGRDWVQLVRGKNGAPATTPPCTKCGRFTSATATHRCPVPQTAAVGENAHYNNAYLLMARRARTSWGSGLTQAFDKKTVLVTPGRAARWLDAKEAQVSDAQREAVVTLAAYAGSDRLPRAWQSATKVLPARSNGDGENLYFAGVTGKDAAQLSARLPSRDQLTRIGNGPTLAQVLASSAKHQGIVEALGRVNVDENTKVTTVASDGFYVFDDSPDPATVMRRAATRYGITTPKRAPEIVEQVEVPWRPGEKAWKLQWVEQKVGGIQ